MTAAVQIIEPAPRIEVARDGGGEFVLLVGDGRRALFVALTAVERRLAIAAYRNTLGARALGGLTTTIMLGESALAWSRGEAVAIRLSADARGVVLAVLGATADVLVQAPFSSADFSRLTGDPEA